MMRRNNNYIATISWFLLSLLTKTCNSFARFSVVDGFSVKHTTGQEPSINYNTTKYNLQLSECHAVDSSFSVDPFGQTHSASLPKFALSIAQDLFSWSANDLSAIFNNTLNTATLSSKCVLQSLTNGTKQLLTCDNSQNDLAVIYDASFELRNGIIGFSNPGATLFECLNKIDGFLVTGYQSNATSTTASPSSTSSMRALQQRRH